MIQPLAPLPALPPAGNTSPAASGLSFGRLLGQALAAVNRAELQGQQALVGVAAGTTSVEAAVVAVDASSLMLNLTASVRNEVVQAYQAIWNMQV